MTIRTRSSRRNVAATLMLAVAPVAAIFAASSAHAATDTWTGNDFATSPNWSDAANWANTGNAPPVAGDSLIFDGTNTTSNDDFAGPFTIDGITFAPTAGNFTLTSSGGSFFLSGQANPASYPNGITNGSSNNQTVSVNSTLDWGYYTFNSSAGGSLALNGSLSLNTGGMAYFAGNITSTSLTSGPTGLINGISGAGLIYNPTATADGVAFTSLAAVSGGIVGPYNYATDSHAVSISGNQAIPDVATNNIQMTNTAVTALTLAATVTHFNTLFSGCTTAGAATTTGYVQINPAANQTLVAGAGSGIGGFYAEAGGTATTNKNLITIETATGASLTAGTGTAPGTLVFAVNGGSTGNQMAVNLTVTDNKTVTPATPQPVTVIKTGPGSMFLNVANTYSGGTYIDQGYVQGNTGTSFGTGPIFVAVGATAYLNATATFANNIFLTPGTGAPVNGVAGEIKAAGVTLTGTLTLLGAPAAAGTVGDRIGQSGNNTTLSIKGQVTGTGTLDVYSNAVTTTQLLANTGTAPNNWTGGVQIDNAGSDISTLKLGANDQIPNGAGFGNLLLNQAGSGTAKFDLAGFTETINGLATAATPTTPANNIVTNTGNATTLTLGDGNATATFGGVITDGGIANALSITKIGSGTETLSGANTNNGTYTVNGGTLLLNGSIMPTVTTAGPNIVVSSNAGSTFTMGSGSTIASTANLTVNGTFNMSGSPTIATLNGTSASGNMNLAGGGLTVSGGGNFAGAISDSIGGGSLTISGGNLTLSGASTFAGNTTLNAGALYITGTFSSPINNANGGILGGNGTINTVNLAGATINPGTLASPIGVLTINNLTSTSGTLQFDATGATTDQITGGTVNLSGTTITVDILPSSSVTPGTYTLLTATSLTTGGLTINTPSGTRQAFNVVTNPSNIQLIVGAGTPANLIWKTAAGAPTPHDGITWDVTTNNNWTATATPSNGSATQYYQLDNVTFDDTTNNSRTVTLSGTLTPSSVTVNTAGTYTFSGGGSIAGATGITLTGGGTLSLNNGSNTYTGNTAVQNGTLQIASSSAFPASSAIILGDVSNHGGTLDLDGNTITVSGISTVGTGSNVIGNSNNSSNATLIISGGNTTFSGSIVDGLSGGTLTTSLNVTGNATLALTGPNTYSGSTNINTGSTLQINGAGTLNAASSITLNGTLSFSPTTSTTIGNNINGSGNIIAAGGTTILTGSNSYANTTINTGATLQIGNNTSNTSLGTGNVTDNGNLTFSLSAPVTISNIISGTGNVSNSGTGPVTISGNNTYTGATHINAGTVVIANANAFGQVGATNGGVTVASGAVLDLSGITAALAAPGLGASLYTISGNGTGSGAIVFNPTTSTTNIYLHGFNNLTLAADASMGGTNPGFPATPNSGIGRIDIGRDVAGSTLNLNGHTLTWLGTNYLNLATDLTVSAGNIVFNTGTLSFDTGVTDNHPTDGNIILNSPAQLQFFTVPTGHISTPIIFNGGGNMGQAQNNNGSVINSNMFANAAVTINDLNGANAASTLTLTGVFSDVTAAESALLATNPSLPAVPVGPGSIVKNGTQTLVLAGNNIYSGGTAIASGTVRLGSNSGIPLNTAVVMGSATSSGTLDLAGFTATLDSLTTITGGNGTIGSSSTIAPSTLIFAGNATPSTFGGLIEDVIGTGNQTTSLQVTSGSLTLSGNNTYTGATSVNAGATLSVAVGGSISATTPVTNNGTINFSNPTRALASLSGTTIAASVNLNTTALTINATSSYAGSINDNATNGSLIIPSGVTFTNGSVNVTNLSVSGNEVFTNTTIRTLSKIGSTALAGNLTVAGSYGGSATAASAYTAGIDLTTSRLIVEDASGNRTNDLAYLKNLALPSNTTGNVGIFSSTAAAANLLAGRTDQVVAVVDNAVRMATFPTGSTNFGSGTNNVDANSILLTATYLGDANLDGQVNILDLQDLANHWQQNVTDWSQGDFNGDGIVNILDLQALANHWQFGVGSGNGSGESFSDATSLAFGNTAATPEPASLALLGLGGVVLASRRRRN